jgi:hypothetical protein
MRVQKIIWFVIFFIVLTGVLIFFTSKIGHDEYAIAAKTAAKIDQAVIKNLGKVESISVVKVISASDENGFYRDYHLNIQGKQRNEIIIFRCRKKNINDLVCGKI